ncbi:hypothetical protein NBRC116583_02460 [Arenicella sp. 4NH20-0111]|uniref:5' nucleotidase, NT5C type n=1 Tax=Arenicella sp. 4NH20-0111 TaxID=3127648 RepID=UPI00310309AF
MKIVYIDMDDTLCDFKKSYKQSLIERPEIAWPHSREGFFVELEPLPQALEAVNSLIKSSKYDAYILTSPSVRNPRSYIEKRLWIEKHFGLTFCKKLIISPNKALNTGHYLIDDNIEGKGQEHFQGELIQYGSGAFPNWGSIIRYLEI